MDGTTRDGAPVVPAPRLRPVVLGGDLGAYGLARTFHQAYGVEPVVVSVASTSPVKWSTVLRNVVEPQMDDPDVLVRRLRELAAEEPDKDHVVVASADWLVGVLVARRA